MVSNFKPNQISVKKGYMANAEIETGMADIAIQVAFPSFMMTYEYQSRGKTIHAPFNLKETEKHQMVKDYLFNHHDGHFPVDKICYHDGGRVVDKDKNY